MNNDYHIPVIFHYKHIYLHLLPENMAISLFITNTYIYIYTHCHNVYDNPIYFITNTYIYSLYFTSIYDIPYISLQTHGHIFTFIPIHYDYDIPYSFITNTYIYIYTHCTYESTISHIFHYKHIYLHLYLYISSTIPISFHYKHIFYIYEHIAIKLSFI